MSLDALDAAVLAHLRADPVIGGNVWWAVAPPGVDDAFVIVDQLAHEADPVMPASTVFERVTYLVKAVVAGPDASTWGIPAGERIHELLEARLDIPVDGYVIRNLRRTHRVRITEIDEGTDARWQHYGGHYEITAAPVEAVP